MTHKSPSVKKRDMVRMMRFNMKKKEEEFDKERISLNLKIQKLEKELEQNSKPPKNIICTLQPIDIQPVAKHKNLSKMKTSRINIQPFYPFRSQHQSPSRNIILT